MQRPDSSQGTPATRALSRHGRASEGSTRWFSLRTGLQGNWPASVADPSQNKIQSRLCLPILQRSGLRHRYAPVEVIEVVTGLRPEAVKASEVPVEPLMFENSANEDKTSIAD